MKNKLIVVLLLLMVSSLFAQRELYEPYPLSDAFFQKSDFGSMWTFDDVPFDRFEKLYGFTPDEEWLEHAQKSALKFGGGCSAAFLSEDGLIMTNHHCIRGKLKDVQKEGENLLKDGFYAPTLEEERKVPGLYVDQLIFIEDVTDEIIAAINEGSTDADKIKNRADKIAELENTYSEESGLKCQVVTLYNGGKFSLYGYKRYNDVRLVMVPDFQIAATGWDWDNFTYPRYELDFAFCRAYDEEGNPIKSENHFTWSKKGAVEGEPIFVVGNPGNTDRLLPYDYLEYMRDNRYPQLLTFFNGLYDMYFELFKNHPERESELLNLVMSWGNARKSYAGSLSALRDEYIMAKKKDFEKQLLSKIKADPKLNEKYGHVWDEVKKLTEELSVNSNELFAFRQSRFDPAQFKVANSLVRLAKELSKPEDERAANYKGDELSNTIDKIASTEIDTEENQLSLMAHTNLVLTVGGVSHPIAKDVYGADNVDDAIANLLSKTQLNSSENIKKFANQSPDEILNSDDPFIKFILLSNELQDKHRENNKAKNERLQVLLQLAGEAVAKVFGDQLPPDATGTLRISDGVIKGYEYNGTIAPGKVSYYGLWDRFHSFGGDTYPWGLHERWKTPPPELDLSIPCGFASTNDIVGGNSGSSVINKNFEVVGLVHDGNLESLAGTFIFLPENNRTVATDSWGMLEALKYVFKSEPLVKELENGKL